MVCSGNFKEHMYCPLYNGLYPTMSPQRELVCLSIIAPLPKLPFPPIPPPPPPPRLTGATARLTVSNAFVKF